MYGLINWMDCSFQFSSLLLLLQKLRQCSIVFEGVDPGRYGEDWEVKRNTLLEVVDYCDAAGRQLFTDFRVLDDTFTMIKLHLFRSLPRAPEPSGDPDEEEESFSDPQWAQLNVVYELLLRTADANSPAVSSPATAGPGRIGRGHRHYGRWRG